MMNIFSIFSKKLFIFTAVLLLITNYGLSQPNIPVPNRNIILHAETKDFPKISLLDKNKNIEYFINFNNKITVINFWATWCAPCKKEMPSLNKLVEIVGKNNIQVIGVNVEGVTYDKAKAFLDDLKVTNFDTFFDQDLQLVKQLSLRGVPTTLLINKEGKEFARVVGSINFEDSKFIDWIKQF